MNQALKAGLMRLKKELDGAIKSKWNNSTLILIHSVLTLFRWTYVSCSYVHAIHAFLFQVLAEA